MRLNHYCHWKIFNTQNYHPELSIHKFYIYRSEVIMFISMLFYWAAFHFSKASNRCHKSLSTPGGHGMPTSWQTNSEEINDFFIRTVGKQTGPEILKHQSSQNTLISARFRRKYKVKYSWALSSATCDENFTFSPSFLIT